MMLRNFLPRRVVTCEAASFFAVSCINSVFIGEFEVVSVFVQCFLLRENSLLYFTQIDMSVSQSR